MQILRLCNQGRITGTVGRRLLTREEPIMLQTKLQKVIEIHTWKNEIIYCEITQA